MNRAERSVAVTLALMGAGAIAGAAAGAAALTLSLLMTEPLFGNGRHLFGGLVVGAFLGAPFGAVTAPAIGWLLLRRVPLGQMFVSCTAGSAIGGVLGWVAGVSTAAPLTGLIGAFSGCVVTAVVLRHRLEA